MAIISMQTIAKGNKGNKMPIDTTLAQILKNIMVMSFKWNNMPKEIPTKIMEEILFNYGKAVFFQVGGKYFALSCTLDSDLDVYGREVSVTPIAINGTEFPSYTVLDHAKMTDGKVDYNKQNGVLIWNNLDKISTMIFMNPFITRLNYIWNSIGITQALSRVKMLVKTTQNQKSSVHKEMNRLFDGVEAISTVTDKAMTDGIEMTNTGVSASDIEPLWYDFDKTFNLLFTLIGINNNMHSDKKERMIVDEVNSNNEMIHLFKATMLEFRKEACEEINRVFGLNVSVEPYTLEVEYEEVMDDESDDTEQID